jgi:hypothetical protein
MEAVQVRVQEEWVKKSETEIKFYWNNFPEMIQVNVLEVVEYKDRYYSIASIMYYDDGTDVFVCTDKDFKVDKNETVYKNPIDLPESLLEMIHKKMKSKRLEQLTEEDSNNWSKRRVVNELFNYLYEKGELN